MTFRISILGASDGPEVVISGPGSGQDGIWLASGAVDGLYEAPVNTEWSRARRQRGASLKGVEHPERDMTLGFHVSGPEWGEAHDLLRSLFTYELDPWWPGDELARIVIESADDRRELRVQLAEEPDFAPDIDPELLQYGNVVMALKAPDSFWESPTIVSAWESTGASGSGHVTVSNPTDQVMFQKWTLTPGTWTLPDFAWTGAPRRRVPASLRAITLQPVTEAMGELVIDLDPMDFRMEAASGENVMGQVGGGYYFLHEIPPHTPKTELPVSVEDAPVGGARVELVQPRLWGSFLGGY